MAMSLKNVNNAYELLKKYNGNNSYLVNLKNDVYVYKNTTLNDFQIEYILKNYDSNPIYLNKIIKIAKWYGEKRQIDWNTEFVPEKLLIGYYLGETEQFYHAYVRYRRSQEKMIPLFIPKKAILNPLFLENFENKLINFDKYNKMSGLTLKPHQELAVKFLTTRKKCILALEMGLGKSISAIVAALEDDYKKILIICPASIKSTWERELRYFINKDEITTVEGKNWKDNKFTIINYDILDNFYEIPTEKVKRRVKNVDENGKISYQYVEKEVISRKSDIIDEAMANSQLFQSKFDLIIIDEAHRLSNSTSGRYKIITDLIKRSNPSGIYELTGTMITNNPMNLYNILKIIDAEITKDWQSYVKTYCEGKQIFRKGERDKFTNIFLKKVNKKSWNELSYQQKTELNEYLDKNCKKIWITNGASNLDELKERIKHIYLREINTNVKGMVKKDVIINNYTLNNDERTSYSDAWDDYVRLQEENGKSSVIDNKQLIEGSVLRQITSQLMIPYTIKLAKEHLAKGEKVIIVCCFDKELQAFKDEFGDVAVTYNGKMNRKQKDEAEHKFMNDDNTMVFIGNIQASCVGLTLISSHVLIFNSVSWLPADNTQMEFRILRIGQKENCIVYYQKFENTYMDRIFEILDIKNQIIDAVIVDEKSK